MSGQPGGDPAAGTSAIAARLRELAEELRDPELGEADAERLAREAADLVGRAGNEIERTVRELEQDREP